MIYVNYYSSVNALGTTEDEILRNLSQGVSPGIVTDDRWLANGKKAVFGEVTRALAPIPASLKKHDSRNNRLLLAAIDNQKTAFYDCLNRFDPNRVAIVMGTSTSGSDEAGRYIAQQLRREGEQEYFHGWLQELGDPSRFLSLYLGLKGPSYTISTACTSSARAVISGARLIEAGLADAAVVGGADTLAQLPIYGFSALEVMSESLCRPFEKDRRGITIGEGSGIMILSKRPSDIALLGWGESSDAHHISSPHPSGEGAYRAMAQAQKRAGIRPSEIAYLNLHGTGTALNDSAEGEAVRALFGSVPCSSTKNLTGHCLGAAGIVEAVLLCQLLSHPAVRLPAQMKDPQAQTDDQFRGLGLLEKAQTVNGRYMQTNNLAFGGNNTSLIFGAQHATTHASKHAATHP